ncbi:LysM peptidoglycan-binding and 3D domain-containing protein [Robertmurraya kyonggiensis]|uniref:LysM peptidoglycan-binding domain-containing protein n=1 Tax=Robertmurraya kyonggiensis TaxID=1037680 RepID=A0A4U1D8J6_9BACI|nr:3D domain-containing protein [Robertmurraya kyonggiensis]TKC18764.1 LysM peptidoglycan-binding domain-containing protein [Robertmurraya kyonggiensis]
MKRKLATFVATTAIFTSVATTAQAQEVTVHKGDTIWGFSKEYGVSVDSIKKWNNLSSDLIHPKDVLVVSPEKKVVVKKGDTLWQIARDNGVTVEQLKEWNNLTSDLIHPGLNLTIELGKTNTAQSTSAGTKTPAPVQNAPAQATTQTNAQASTAPVEGKVITVEATAYTSSCEGCSGITSTGINLKENPDAKVISVDPTVIPLGSKVYVEGYGYATAADTGGAIKGNKIDVFVPNHADAVQFGRKQVKVTILD